MSKRFTVIAAVVATIGLFGLLSLRPPQAPPTADSAAAAAPRLAQLGGPSANADVSEADLKLYLDVYKAMQSDHSKRIEEALAPQGISLTAFRDIERRVQLRSNLVERVRRELLAHAQEVSIFGNVKAATPSPSPAP